MSEIRSDTIESKPHMAKTVSVLVRATHQDSEFIGFRNSDYLEAPENRGRSRHLRFAYEDWDDMGKPDEITVTIEPGDKLNV
jgi:hypothetical protein